MAELTLIGVRNRFVHHTDLRVPDGGICAIVGPSGAGKTSLLKIIAGLTPHEGKILIDNREIQDLAPNRRFIGFVSQDLHLFPHLSLEGNIYLAMTRLKVSRFYRRRRAVELMELLRITHLSGRKPDTFSGGEKQRAALARVLASSPRLLLLDEPFSKLDFRTARYLRSEFRNLRERLGLTTIIVTHDLDEASYLAKTVLVMRSGALAVEGGPLNGGEEENNHAESFLETPNILPCRIIRVLDVGLVETRWAGGILLAPDEGKPFNYVSIGRRDIELGGSAPEGPAINRFVGLIRETKTTDDAVLVSLDVGEALLQVEVTREQWNILSRSPNGKLHGYMKLRALNTR